MKPKARGKVLEQRSAEKSTRTSKRILTLGNFLNVDVELISRRQLKALADELRKWILHHGPLNDGWLLTFETNSIQGKSTPDGVIARLCKLIENLSPAARRHWEAAQSRVFDIGFESAPTKKGQNVVVRSTFSEKSLRRIADLGANLDIPAIATLKNSQNKVRGRYRQALLIVSGHWRKLLAY